MKTLNIKLVLLCLMVFMLAEKNFSQITFIQQNSNFTTVVPVTGWPSNFSWSVDLCSSVTSYIENQNVHTFYMPYNPPCCKVRIDAIGQDDGQLVSASETFNILPGISTTVTGDIYPNQLLYVNSHINAGTANGLDCAAAHGCPNATITWRVNGANCGSCSGTNIGVTIPGNSSISNPVTVDATYNCGSSHQLNQLTLNVVLRDPSLSGPTSIGCGSTPTYTPNSLVTYTATYSNPTYTAGVAYWVWGYPPNMVPIGGVNGQTITFNVVAPGTGNISVQAFSGDGTVKSNSIHASVTSCCIPVINDNTALNSGNAGYQVEASSIINSTNDLQSTATATMHAGTEVRLLPGFNAAQGSQAHFYIAPCNSGYLRTMASTTSGGNDTAMKHKGITATDAHASDPSLTHAMTPTGRSPANAALRKGFRVAPNPGSGVFSIDLNGSPDLPLEVTVMDGLGNPVQRTGQIVDRVLLVNLEHYPDGIYSVKAVYRDRVESKLIVKHSD